MQWQAGLVALHALSNLAMAVSFLVIVAGIVWYMRRRFGMLREYRVVAWLFCGFILAAGVSHLIEAAAIWYPIHALHGLSIAATALLATSAIVLIWPLLPALARMPSSRDLAEVNQRLRQESQAHEATLRELEQSRRELESRVEERSRELGVAKAWLETALHGSNVIVYTQDRDLRFTAVSNGMLGLPAAEIVGRLEADVMPPGSSARVTGEKRRVIEGGQPADVEYSVGLDGTQHWYDVHIEPLRDFDGCIVGITCAAVDITSRKAGEAHLREIMRELTHRSKNLLAVIQGMARQTARHAGSTETFLDRFSARLQALASSHDLLVQESWHGASLSELIRSQLGHYMDRSRSQVAMQGPAILLKPEAAQSLGLALHELAINAAKYGGLSVPAGRVSIDWKQLPAAEGAGIEIVWLESGGPTVTDPEHRGFGSMVIERNLARALDAEVCLDYPPEGARCRMVIPAANLAAGQ